MKPLSGFVFVFAASAGCGPDAADTQDTPDTGAVVCPALALRSTVVDAEPLVADPAAMRAPSGLAVADLDGDGVVELWYASMGGSVVFATDGAVLTPSAAFTVDGGPPPAGLSAAGADIDGDGDTDLFLGGWAGTPDRILWNDGAGVFTSEELPDSSGLSNTGLFADLDGDGALDLFVGRGYADAGALEDVLASRPPGDPSSLYRWDGTRLVDVSSRLPPEVAAAHTMAAAVFDADADGDLDLWLANDYGPFIVPDQLLENRGDHFVVGLGAGASLAHYGMGVAVGDADGDGRPDLYISDIGGPELLLGQGDGTFVDATLARGASLGSDPDRLTSWATRFVDVDGDGADDLTVAFGRLDADSQGHVDALDPSWVAVDPQRDALLLANGAGGFRDAGDSLGFSNPGRHRPLVSADLDGDLIPEVIVGGANELVVYRFSGGCPGRAVIDVVGDQTTAAIGATVVVTAGARTTTRWVSPASTGSASGTEVYAGLGDREAAEVEVTWPDGRQARYDVEAGAYVHAAPMDAR